MLKETEVLGFVVKEFERLLAKLKVPCIIQKKVMIALHEAVEKAIVEYYRK